VLALVLAGGDLVATERVDTLVAAANLVVAADGGARHALALGLKVDAWVGDFDSTDESLDKALADVPREAHSRDKDLLDTELALATARERGASRAIVLGAFGGRSDHALALMLASARNTLRGYPVELESGRESGHPATPNHPLTLALTAGQTFSVLALNGDAQGVTVSGARWPLGGVTLEAGVGWGVSNEAGGPVRVSVASGAVLVIVQHETG
jgi:thiamine pyrophosphokinase